MKTIRSVIILVLVTVTTAQAQVVSPSGRYLTADVSVQNNLVQHLKPYYGSEPFTLNQTMGAGLTANGKGAIGFGLIGDYTMFEILIKSGERAASDYFGMSGKIGKAFELTSSENANLNLYGMAGYGFFEERFESSEENKNGLLLEAGAVAAFRFGEISAMGLGAGYVVDMGLEQQYFNFKLYLFPSVL